ncbi:MAG: DUF402 domain-containing protein [Blastocatellia bacterium]
MQNELVTVNSRKYDLSIRRSWECRLLERSEPLLIFVGEFEKDIEHPELGTIAKGTISYEYYWLNRWYNVFKFHEPTGSFRNFYCNINLPPTFNRNVLDYVDLDIDVLVWPDGRTETLDVGDFEVNATKFDYPAELRAKAFKTLDEVLEMIAARKFPFDI